MARSVPCAAPPGYQSGWQWLGMIGGPQRKRNARRPRACSKHAAAIRAAATPLPNADYYSQRQSRMCDIVDRNEHQAIGNVCELLFGAANVC